MAGASADPNTDPTIDAVKRWLGLHQRRLYYSASVIYALIGIARLTQVPSAQFWIDYGFATALSLFFLSAGIYLGTAWRIGVLEGRLERVNADLQAARRRWSTGEERWIVTSTCATIAEAVARVGGIPLANIGVSTWRIPVNSDAPLERVARYRRTKNQPAGIRWTKGKGAVGQVWAGPYSNVVVDTARFRDLDEAAFTALPEATRVGMDWRDWCASQHVWSIWGTALKNLEGVLFGCISVDCDAQGFHDELIAASKHPDVLELVDLASKQLQKARTQ